MRLAHFDDVQELRRAVHPAKCREPTFEKILQRKITENNQRAKYYRLTRAGCRIIVSAAPIIGVRT